MKFLIGLAALAVLSCAPAREAEEAAVTAEGTLLVGNKGEDSLSFIALADGRELGRAATGRMPHEIAVSRRPAGGGGRLWRPHGRHIRRGEPGEAAHDRPLAQ